jgi:hypothetical protein
MAFFELLAVMYVSEFIASPLAGYLMGEDGQHPWIPMLVAYGAILLATLITCFLPETLGLRTATEDAEAVPADEPEEEMHDETVADKAEHAAVATWKGLITSAKQVWTFIFRDTRVAWLLFSLLFLLFGRFVQEILMQYATKRYDWSWTKVRALRNIPLYPARTYELTIFPRRPHIGCQSGASLNLSRISSFCAPPATCLPLVTTCCQSDATSSWPECPASFSWLAA